MKSLLTATVVLCLAVPVSAFGQTINATLGGTVTDSSGALIPGVTITATNLATGIVTSVLSNEAGAYNFASIQSGTYKVTAELPGFQTDSTSNFSILKSRRDGVNRGFRFDVVPLTNSPLGQTRKTRRGVERQVVSIAQQPDHRNRTCNQIAVTLHLYASVARIR